MKKIGPILFVAATCIGSGMVALPMVLAKIGLAPSILLMLSIWLIMYYSSLINLELNLQAGQGLPLGALGRLFSGRMAESIGVVSLKLLSYSLLAVFIYGGSSIIQELLAYKMAIYYSFESIELWFSIVACALLLFPLNILDYINRILFIALLGVIAVLIAGLAFSTNWVNLPWFSVYSDSLPAWSSLIPVVFSAFGFQVIFHTLTNWCHKNAYVLKHVFFWGSLIPAIVYVLWACTILTVVYHENLEFYYQMVEGKAEVGELIQVLSSISQWQSVQLLVWLISLLAIVTSLIGVGIGLFDSINSLLPEKMFKNTSRNAIASITTILPAYFVAFFVPNAFISVLGFAGLILAIIAILLPVFLLEKIKNNDLFYNELKAKWMVNLTFAIGLGVIACEIYNIISS